MMQDVCIKKAYSIADKAIRKAKEERDKKGYRENLGFDQANKVRDEISKLGLEYRDMCQVMDYFDSECCKI